MKVHKKNVVLEDKEYAYDILNKLRTGTRVFGSPGEGLRKTLRKLEENKPAKDSFDNITYNIDDGEWEEQVAKLKKGIKGEETLGEYFEKVIRLDRKLSDIVVYASLGDEDSGKDYIPDTDFLCVYGNNLLCVDAKNIRTNPDIPIFVSGNGIYSAINHDTPILEVSPQTHVWNKIIHEGMGTLTPSDLTVHGCVCIINKTGSFIHRDEEYMRSEIKPIHISELVDFLHAWIKGKEPIFDLELLTVIAKTQIRQEKSSIDLTYGKRIFGV